MNKLSDLLVIDRHEAEILLTAFNEWWIPQILKNQDKAKVMEYDKLAKTLRYFVSEEDKD